MNRTRVVNADVQQVEGEGKHVTPHSMARIRETIMQAADGWPRRVANALFVHQPREAVAWLESVDALFGWLGAETGVPPKFERSAECHTMAQVFAELRRTAQAYEAVEVLPHEPLMQDHYYACEIPEPGDGTALRGLVDRYAPETDIDGDLISAMFVTPTWGGPCGARPAFLIQSDHGRGSGKSKLASHVGYLHGGAIELSSNEDAAVLKQRLLSPEGLTKRIASLDNVKSMRFSWAELEALITAPVVSGKRLYVGESRRPNNLTFVITMNGPSLSKDIAQRCVIVKLARPKHSATGEEETRAYIDKHRRAIIADCIVVLKSPRSPLAKYSRWGAWEHDVLSRLPEPSDAQQVILERQAIADADDDEAGLIQDYFRGQLLEYAYDADRDAVFIPSKVAADWFCTAMNERISTPSVSKRLNQSINEGTVTLLQPNRCNGWGRGFVWRGTLTSPATTVSTDLESRIRTNQRF
mgnify:CR=1 FL=1